MSDFAALDLPALILDVRDADLRRRQRFHLPERQAEFDAWRHTCGLREYAALRQLDPHALRAAIGQPVSAVAGLSALALLVWQSRTDVQRAFPLPERRDDYRTWFYVHGVGEHDLWPWMSARERSLLCRLSGPWQTHFITLAGSGNVPEANIPAATTPVRPGPGVNLHGYVFGQLGIGEDVRMAARALLTVGVPVAMVNVPPGKDIAQNDRSMAAHVVSDGPHAINLVCMTALEHGRYYLERGRAPFDGRYTIGYWPWELSRWPAAWTQLVHLVDELWVSTRHTFDAVAPVCAALVPDLPVRILPMAVDVSELPANTCRRAVRQRHGLPVGARLFVFTFDLNSSIHRKNPQAVVEAFLRAFPAGGEHTGVDAVGLVIKVHPPKRRHRAWERLKATAAADPRLHLIEATLSRPDLLALYHACDCFVSLHRAEGFGRGIAEALQLGLHVITTGYSGNVDFCAAPEFADAVDRVRHRLCRVRPGQYPFADGQHWASPSVAHAAECMRAFLARFPPGEAAAPPHPVPPGGWPRFSLEQVGRQYVDVLAALPAWGSLPQG